MEFTNEQKKEIRKMVREEIIKMIPDLFGRSLVQIKKFFIAQIKN